MCCCDDCPSVGVRSPGPACSIAPDDEAYNDGYDDEDNSDRDRNPNRYANHANCRIEAISIIDPLPL